MQWRGNLHRDTVSALAWWHRIVTHAQFCWSCADRRAEQISRGENCVREVVHGMRMLLNLTVTIILICRCLFLFVSCLHFMNRRARDWSSATDWLAVIVRCLPCCAAAADGCLAGCWRCCCWLLAPAACWLLAVAASWRLRADCWLFSAGS